MSFECLQRCLESGQKSGQRSRHQSRQMARFPSSKRGQITNRDKNHDTLSRFGVMQAAHRLIATFAEAAEKKANPRYEALDGNRLKDIKLSTQGSDVPEIDFGNITQNPNNQYLNN